VKPKNPSNRRGGEFGTCIACDRPIDSDDPQHGPEDCDVPMRHRAQQEVQAAASSSQAVDSVPEHQRSSSQAPKDATSSRPSSAAMRNRIDTKTVIRGRSGASNVRPKISGDAMHYAPGTSDFVYRGGFRIPKTNPNAIAVSASINSLLNLSVLSTNAISNDKTEETNSEGRWTWTTRTWRRWRWWADTKSSRSRLLPAFPVQAEELLPSELQDLTLPLCE
jgi:hypothetical protein